MEENTIFQKIVNANQTFVVLPTDNNTRLNTLADKLKAQDIELSKLKILK